MAGRRMLRYCLQALISFCVLASLLPNANSKTEWNTSTYVVNNDTHDDLALINKQGLMGRTTDLEANKTSSTNERYALWFVKEGKLDSYTLSVIVYDGLAKYDDAEMDARIVWTANSSHHVGENATFNFTSDGNLELTDEHGKLAWSSYTSHKGALYLLMSGTGRLILQNQSRGIVWESSDISDASGHKANWRAIASGIVGGLFLMGIILCT